MASLIFAAIAKPSKSPAKVGEGGGGGTDSKMAASGLTENQLQLSVEVSDNRVMGVTPHDTLRGGG